MIAIFPEISACAKSGDSERLAMLVRKYYGGQAPSHPKISLDAICEMMGIGLAHIAIKDVGALIAKDNVGTFTVNILLHSEARAHEQTRFLIAHLIGHYLLHVEPLVADGGWHTSGYREAVSPAQRYGLEIQEQPKVDKEMRREQQADEFAAALILPKAMLLHAKSKLTDDHRIAAFFGTTVGVVRRRLSQLEPMAAPANFIDAERQLEKLASAETKEAPGRGTPRSLATSTYDRTQKNTAVAASAEAKPSAKPAVPAPPASPASRDGLLAKAESGLSRLRRLAKKIDSSVKS